MSSLGEEPEELHQRTDEHVTSCEQCKSRWLSDLKALEDGENLPEEEVAFLAGEPSWEGEIRDTSS